MEDLAMVLALVLLPALAQVIGGSNDSVASEPLAIRFGLGLAGVLVFTFVKVGFGGFRYVGQSGGRSAV